MRKKDELSQPRTCMQSAHPNEMVFVLLSRDPAAPVAIRAWVAERLRINENKETDPKIVEALKCAKTMEIEGRKWPDACCAPVPGFPAHDVCALRKGHDGAHWCNDGMYP